MDQRFTGSSDYIDGFNFDDDLVLPYFDQYPYPTNTNGSEFETPNLNLNSMEPHLKVQSDTSPSSFTSSLSWILDPHQNPSLNPSSESDLSSNTSLSSLTWSPETDLSDSDLFSSLSPEGDSLPSSTLSDESYSDPMLKYIREMLMEENMDETAFMVHDSLALQATEDSLNEILAGNHPPSSDQPSDDVNHNAWSPDDTSSGSSGPKATSSSACISNSIDPQPQLSVNELLLQNMFSDKESILQFQRGVEEARKFLPTGNQLTIALEKNSSSEVNSTSGRKNHGREDTDSVEGRSKKQPAVYFDEIELSEVFDKVLLIGPKPDEYTCGKCDEAAWRAEANSKLSPSNGSKGGTKRKSKKGESVDLRTMLILSAQAVSSDDRRTATELLKQIRQHSSPSGTGPQRLAHYFANGLEARLAGTGTKISPACLGLERTSMADILKAFHLYLLCCPFKKLAICMTIRTILDLSEKATTIHVVDFGVGYGFQWPTLIWHLAYRPGGPPKLRITGIDLPRSGFRPEEGIKQAGRRLANYCERFKVPFEYNTIASQNWETIKLEDIKIHEGETVFANCLLRSHNLLDETVEKSSPRDSVLNLIREMKPAAFIHTIASASYNSPFFVTRFKEALFHYSALFDMFDTTVTREDEERLRYEGVIYGREVMNVVSLEGSGRTERPETYKQWQARSRSAGLRMLPMDQGLMEKVRGDKLKNFGYHKDFVVDEASNWMLQGWKGRILFASSRWTAN